MSEISGNGDLMVLLKFNLWNPVHKLFYYFSRETLANFLNKLETEHFVSKIAVEKYVRSY
jgi:hypothetical protein